ncbi:Histone transcription regulator 3 [Coemansia spiralis]|uniref:Histone transcription regulator 3 n=1 Tax=Coemansia spiralis TaxID=417178 RepID=A0A9W8KYJ1_9FUNG|nr:Histone transcription regulator 3 [Coemansia sp. RSA 1358]KAJ2677721.1 Histone transcription regulator 3 [Coemansia spiralis]
MPVFVPVNPPPVPENAGADALDSTISATPLLRIEEQIRNLVDEYKVALKAWADGQLEEAFRKFDALCNHSLLSQPQETPIEQECTAYSSEYGGMDINYLRALVFMNAGRLHIISNGGPDVCTSLESLGNLESIDSQTAPLFNNKAVLRKAFAFFMEALRFGNADASRYLAIGQCALLLGQPDVAISAFMNKLGLLQQAKSPPTDTQSKDWVLFNRNSGPHQWWCIRAVIKALLKRGDMELACSIINRVAGAYPDHSQALSRDIGIELAETRPTILALPALPDLLLPSVSATPDSSDEDLFVLHIKTYKNTIPLEKLGREILSLYNRYASVSSKSSEDMLFTHVQFSINQVKHPEASTDPVCASDEIADGSLGSVVEDGNIKLSDATNATSNGPDESGGDESTRGVKRRGSQSEDEIPVKRRSTRFIERATLGSMGSSSGTGVSNQVQGAVGSTRTAPSRSNVRRALTMAFEPIESPAMQTGCELANTWLQAIGAVENNGFLALLSKSGTIAKVFTRQQQHQDGSTRKHSATSVFPINLDSCSTSDWFFPLDKDKETSPAAIASSLPEISNTNESTRHEYLSSLKLFLKNQPPSTCDKPSELPALLDQDASSICGYMRADWTQLMKGATDMHGLAMDELCIRQYRLVESWSEYEASVITGNMERAKASILECRRLIQQASYEAERPEIVVCSFSRAPITLSLIERRLEHLSLFTKLHEAEQLAANDPNSAAALLDSAIKPFSENVSNALAFSQTISATRLLSSLHNKLGNTRKETAAIMYELYLYISRMLASDENADSSLPARQLVEHCVDCLRRIQQLSNSDDLVYQSLSSSNMSKPLRYFVAQLVTLSLGFSGYFATDPPGECPAVSLEARFIGMSIWLAAALTSKANIVQFEPPQLDSVLAVNIETNSTPTSDATVPTDASAGSVEVPDIRMQFMSSIHSLLGERGLCTAAHGALLLHLLSVCNNCLRFDKDNAVCWDMAAACLRCLFDIKLHGSDAEMHLCEHIDMDETAANLVFTLIEADLLDTLRSRKGTGLRSDLKAIVDKTGSVLGDIDTAKYPRLGMNMDIIDDYLDGLSMPSFAQVESALCSERDVKVPVACLPVKEGIKDSGILPAYLTLPFVRAITQHELLLARMRSGHSRPVEEYDNIIEDYKLNVALNPESPEAWYHLGQAHSDLANELLLGTASEILGSKYDIAVLQRAAVSCAIQAKQLLSSPDNMRSLSGLCDKAFVEDEESGESALYEQTRKLHIRVYSFTGNLLYRIASRPLSLLAFQILPSNVLISDGADSDEERQEWDVGKWKASGVVDGNFSNTNSTADAITRSLTRRFVAAPSHQRIYKITRRLLANAVRLDSTNWRWVYMLGKAMAKLNDTLSACACYLKAVYLAIAANGKHSALSTSSCAWPTHGPGSNTAASYQIAISNVPEAAMNAVYKLLSTLAKHLYSSSINADTAIRFIESLPFSAVGGTSVNEKPDARFASSGPIEPKSKAVLGTIYSLANQVCAADKRRWHHRLVYLLAWIGHSVMGESEQAKQTLQTLLQTRSSNRQLASFYKPDFEAPGKHYLYLEKYTGLYIDVLIATSDIEGVQNLLRKLKRCSDFLFDSPALLLRANSAEAATLQKMVHDLNCPRFVVDGLGKEHIVLQNALSGASDTQEFSVTRHCRLNRTQFNCARDFARDNISFFVAFQEHISNILAAIEKKKPETNGNADKASGSSTADSTISATDKVEKAQKAIEQYLDTATKAMSLFDLLLEQKKKYSEDADMLSKLNDNLADLYILVLSSYGQERISILIHPHQADDVDELVSMCRKLAAQLASLQALKRPSGSFWQRILFDEASNESSQQYKLLDPLLEFNINKLLDSIRDARALQPNPFVRNKPRSDIVQQAPQAARVASVSSNPDIPS